MDITIYAVLIWITGILIISLDVVILIGSKNLSSKVFTFLTFITALWVISQGFLVSSEAPILADWLIRFQYVLGITIAVGFYHFSTIYPYDTKPSPASLTFSCGIIAIFTYLCLFTNLLLSGVNRIQSIGHWAWEFGQWHLLFDFSFYVLWIIALYKLYRSYKSTTGDLGLNLKNMFWALVVGIIPPALANIFLPSLGEYRLNWLGPITSSIWVFIIAYSIIKYRQMSVKMVVTEVLVIGMTTIFFINIFTDLSLGIWGRLIIFTVFILLGYYLIKIALREAGQREQLNILNSSLSQKVLEQTVEIRRAYEVEKKARADLEKLNDTKDQFIMITQHHLRTPVTSINWGLESILKGDYGALTDGLRKIIGGTLTSGKRLMHIVDDFLNITAIKAGTNILDIESRSLKPAIEDVLDELKDDISRLRLAVEYPRDDADWPAVPIDYDKMREILLIIVENAVRYNREGGTIAMTTKTDDERFTLSIENTGIGITPEEKQRIGGALFYRGDYARKAYPIGMGVGLSVAKAIIKAHHGTFSLESKGQGKGAVATIVLPAHEPKTLDKIPHTS